MNIQNKSARVFVLVFAVVMWMLPQAMCYGRGKKESPDEGRMYTEEAREIDFFMIGKNPMQAPLPGNQSQELAGFYHLFQQVEVQGGAVRISSNREFSLPITSQKIFVIDDSASAIHYKAELVPRDPLSYRIIGEAEFSFKAVDLLSGDRVRFQPGQKAIMDAAREQGLDETLMRVKQISLDKDGTFKGIVEIAVPADN